MNIMTEQKQTVNITGGSAFVWLVFLVLLVLKVNPGGHLDSEVEDWSWWLVTAPLWGVFAFRLAAAVAFGLGYLCVMAVIFVRDRYDRTEFAKKRRIEKNRKRLEAKRAAFQNRYRK